jgi:hypothetical protein
LVRGVSFLTKRHLANVAILASHIQCHLARLPKLANFKTMVFYIQKKIFYGKKQFSLTLPNLPN